MHNSQLSTINFYHDEGATNCNLAFCQFAFPDHRPFAGTQKDFHLNGVAYGHIIPVTPGINRAGLIDFHLLGGGYSHTDIVLEDLVAVLIVCIDINIR